MTTDAALIEWLAPQGIRRLPTADLKAEVEYAVYLLAEIRQRNNCELGYREYVVKRAMALRNEMNRRMNLTRWQAREPASIPLEFIRELKASVRIDDIFNDFLGILCRQSGPNRMTYPCPAHPDRRPSGCLYLDQGTYHCFSCGAHGDCFDALMAFKGLSFVQAVDAIAGHQGLSIPKAKRRKGTVPV